MDKAFSSIPEHAPGTRGTWKEVTIQPIFNTVPPFVFFAAVFYPPPQTLYIVIWKASHVDCPNEDVMYLYMYIYMVLYMYLYIHIYARVYIYIYTSPFSLFFHFCVLLFLFLFVFLLPYVHIFIIHPPGPIFCRGFQVCGKLTPIMELGASVLLRKYLLAMIRGLKKFEGRLFSKKLLQVCESGGP